MDDRTVPVPGRPAAGQLPSNTKMLLRGTFRGCPLCGRHGLFRWGLQMVPNCPRCGLRFERIEGHFIGAVGMNTIASFIVLLVVVAVSLYIGYPEFPMVPLMSISISVAVLAPLLLYGTSKTLWTAIDLAMRPLEPHEADLTQVRP